MATAKTILNFKIEKTVHRRSIKVTNLLKNGQEHYEISLKQPQNEIKFVIEFTIENTFKTVVMSSSVRGSTPPWKHKLESNAYEF